MPRNFGRSSLAPPFPDLLSSSPLSTPPPSSSPTPRKPITSSATDAESQRTRTHAYHLTRPLPFELSQHISHYIEESLFTQAFKFLLSISSGSIPIHQQQVSRRHDSSTDQPTPPPQSPARVIIPPPEYISLGATLAVHPGLTTRTTSKEKHEQSTSALRLLRVVLDVAGTINADLGTAFAYRKYEFRSSRYARALSGEPGEETHDDGFGEGGADGDGSGRQLNTPYANADSIFARAEDFWAVVGWAFNTSCMLESMGRERWVYWKLWMEFMLDVLEADWDVRLRREGEGQGNGVEESLIWQYIELAAGGHGNTRRVIRAIFADGEKASLNEFREVWKGELRAPKSGDVGKKRAWEEIDVEAEVYGDYMAEGESDEDLEDEGGRTTKRGRTRTPSARRLTPRTSNQSLKGEVESDAEGKSRPTGNALERTDALRLRMRLLALLYQVAIHPALTSTSPTTFPDLDDLLHFYVEQIAPVSLGVFSLIILPSTPVQCLGVDEHVTLSVRLLQRLLESAAPGVRNDSSLTQGQLESDFLRFCARKTGNDANARVSLLLESLVRISAMEGKLRWSKGLEKALESGIENRISKAQEGDGRKKGAKKSEGPEKEAWNVLSESGQRMRFVVKQLRKS